MGGGGSTKSKQKSVTTAKSYSQQIALNKMLALYSPMMGQNENVWQGERVAPLTSAQQSAISGAENYAPYFSTPQQVGMPLYGQTGQATAELLAGTAGAKPMSDTDVQDYFQAKYYDPSMTSLKKDVLPMVDESYAGPGFFGSDRSHARQEAVQDVNDRLAEQWADLNWNVLTQNQALDEAKAGRQLSALSPAMAFSQLPAANVQANLQNAIKSIEGLDAVFGMGQKEQTQEQAELQAAITKFAEENQLTDPDDLAVLMSLLDLGYGRTDSTGYSTGWDIHILS